MQKAPIQPHKQNKAPSKSQHAYFDIQALKTSIFGPLSLILAKGECVSIRGKSGAGKSVFLRAIVDLDPNEGRVSLGGVERASIPAYEWRRKVSFVPAESGWWADSVGEHFKYPEKAAEIFKALGLPKDVLSWQVNRLSTGERQRLSIARALSLTPEILLLDEPTAALDPQAAGLVEVLMRQKLTAGTSIIFVTHDADQAQRMADRTFLLEAHALTEDNAEDLT